MHILLLVAALALAYEPAAAPPQPKTVVDFFLLVPDQYLPYYDLEFRKEFVQGKRRGTIIDVPHGFLSWDASDSSEYFEFAIFKKSDGGYVIAYSSPYDSQGPNYSDFLLLSYKEGKWRDVTKALLPVPHDRELTYGLPREGREIFVASEDASVRYVLAWTGDRFVKRAAPPLTP